MQQFLTIILVRTQIHTSIQVILTRRHHTHTSIQYNYRKEVENIGGVCVCVCGLSSPPEATVMVFLGQVLVFSITGCPFCARAKRLLTDLEVPFVDVNLEKYPDRRYEMQERTGRRTVPQIFFNSEHIGGYDEMKKLVSSHTHILSVSVSCMHCRWSHPLISQASISHTGPDPYMLSWGGKIKA